MRFIAHALLALCLLAPVINASAQEPTFAHQGVENDAQRYEKYLRENWAADGQDPIEVFIQYGRQVRFIRPSSRIETRVPVILPEQFEPLPPNLVLVRKSRHANKI